MNTELGPLRNDRIHADVSDLLRDAAGRRAVRVAVARGTTAGTPETVRVTFVGVRTLVRERPGQVTTCTADVSFDLHFGDRYPLDLGIECLEPWLAHPNISGPWTCANLQPGMSLWSVVRRLYRMVILEVYGLDSPMPDSADVAAYLREHPGATQPCELDARDPASSEAGRLR